MSAVYCLSGLLSSKSKRLRAPILSLESIIDKMEQKDVAHSLIWNEWPEVIKRIVVDKAKNGAGPIALIVHSQGQEGAAEICQAVAKYGIVIDYLASISPTLGATKAIGSNVVWVDEFYEAASPIQFLRVFGNGRVNYDKSFRGVPNRFNGLPGGHVGVASNTFVVKRVTTMVAKVLRGTQLSMKV